MPTASEQEPGLLFDFNLEKRAGRGEDADPVVVARDDECWLAAFDGVGGAGAQTYEVDGESRTGAYLASRIAARALHTWIVQGEAADRDLVGLGHEFGRALGSAAASLPRRSALNSRMIRPLPTTTAMLQVCAPGAPRFTFRYECRAIWAGDSRVFVLRSDRGLVQLSRDHLREPLDPFENLTADSPMSNYLSADGNFRLEEARYRIETPFIGIAATDGCFGYVDSPIAFESMLLESLRQAKDLAHWRRLLAEAIGAVAADDASAAVGLFGWASFDAARAGLEPRRRAVRHEMDELQAARAAAGAARDAADRAERALEDRRHDVWARYRRGYEGYQG